MSSDQPDETPTLATAVVVCVVLFALYVLFVGSISVNETIAGGLSTILATLWWVRIGRMNGVRFAGWLAAMRPLGGALAALPGATLKVGRQLVGVIVRGGPPGSVAYRPEGESAWASADRPAERAFGLIAASLSPDSFIVREDEGDKGTLDHALARGGSKP